MSALSEALRVGGEGLTQFGTMKMQEDMQARRDAAMAKREESLARLRAGIKREEMGFEAELEAGATAQEQGFKTGERIEKQEFEAEQALLDRESREKVAGIRSESKGKETAATKERTANRLQRERESHRKQMEGHTTWGVLPPEYREEFQAEGDKLIGEGQSAGIAARATLKKLRKLDGMVEAAMGSPKAKGKTKSEIIDLIMKNPKYRSQLGL